MMPLTTPARSHKRLFLYRALRPDEISRGVLIPKKPREPFAADPLLPQVLPFTLGKQPEHAVRAQQWDSNRFPTSGVSTTPHLKRAKHYAKKHHTIAKISVGRLIKFKIQMFRVSKHVPDSLISVPEGDEVILVYPGAEYFPKDIITNIFKLTD